jgi:hypothetical protein
MRLLSAQRPRSDDMEVRRRFAALFPLASKGSDLVGSNFNLRVEHAYWICGLDRFRPVPKTAD